MNSKRFLPLSLLAALFLCGRAHAVVVSFDAVLNGPNEFPPNGSPGTGFARAVFDTVAHTLALDVNFSGLEGPTTVAHIHAATAIPFTGAVGVAVTPGTLPGFPAGVTSGTYTMTLDLSNAANFTASFVTANGGTAASAEAALLAYASGGRAYFNIHTTTFPGGEIRGFFVPTPVPTTDGGTTVLMLAGAVGMMVGLRRNRRVSR